MRIKRNLVLVVVLGLTAVGLMLRANYMAADSLAHKIISKKALDLTADVTDPSGIRKTSEEVSQRIQIAISSFDTSWVSTSVLGRITVIGTIKVDPLPGDEDCKRLPGEMKPGTFTVNWECGGMFLPETFTDLKLKDYPNANVLIVPGSLFEFEIDLDH